MTDPEKENEMTTEDVPLSLMRHRPPFVTFAAVTLAMFVAFVVEASAGALLALGSLVGALLSAAVTAQSADARLFARIWLWVLAICGACAAGVYGVLSSFTFGSF